MHFDLAGGRARRHGEPSMTEENDASRLDQLWQEYGRFLKDWDDLTLARWIAQTLAQLQGRGWRLSHPLVGMYRLAAGAAHRRGLRLSRLVSIPHEYPEANCCGAPLLPLVTRDAPQEGLICSHCNGRALEVDDLPEEVAGRLKEWADRYAPVHDVAHWEENRKKKADDYTAAYNRAADEAEHLLAELPEQILPLFLEHYPAVVWEDHDECLDVRADDVDL